MDKDKDFREIKVKQLVRVYPTMFRDEIEDRFRLEIFDAIQKKLTDEDLSDWENREN